MCTAHCPIESVYGHELVWNVLFAEQTVEFAELLSFQTLLEEHLVKATPCLHCLHHRVDAIKKLHFIFFHIYLYYFNLQMLTQE